MLLISASQRRFELRTAIQESLNLSVSVVATFQEALSAITTGRFTTVVLDESLMDLDPTQADRFLNRCSDELPIFLRLAITGIPRSVRQVQLAIRRFDREQKKRTASVQHVVDSQVRDALTSILLHSQLALKTPGLPEDASRHIESAIQAGITLSKVLDQQTD
jgi:hypothetical protein